jgi:hypothetical protein
VPRVPGAVDINLCARAVRRLGVEEQVREGLGILLEAGLTVHGNVHHEAEPRSDGEGLLNGAGILSKAAVAAGPGRITAGAGDDDAADTAEVGISDLEVQDLARDAGDGRIGGGEVDPGAGVGDVGADDAAGEQRGVCGRQGRDDGIGGCVAAVQGSLDLGEMSPRQLDHTGLEVAVGDRGRHEADLCRWSEGTGEKGVSVQRTWSYTCVQELTVLDVSEGLFSGRIMLADVEGRPDIAVILVTAGHVGRYSTGKAAKRKHRDTEKGC